MSTAAGDVPLNSKTKLANGDLRVSIPNDSQPIQDAINTPDGMLYVSKPFLTPHSKKLKALISFAPRTSVFDTGNQESGKNEFRGFFTLFWISMFLATIQSYIRSYETSGQPLALAFASMFSMDAGMLALSDAVMVGSTVFCVFFGHALKKNWIDHRTSGIVIQHTFQTLLLVSTITWTFNRQWPWVQSGFLTLHCLVMVMKCHSYMSINGYLQWVDACRKDTMAQLRKVTERPEIGGWDKALKEAEANREASPSIGSSIASTPPVGVSANGNAYIDPPTAQALRNRLMKSEKAEPVQVTLEKPPSNTHPLVDHPDPMVSSIAQNLSDMENELQSHGMSPVRWPNNITLANFMEYQLIPTLVYELEYPRTDRIRPLYLLEKTVATFGSFALLYTVTANVILPLVPTREQSFFRSLLDLALPFMVAYLLLFYIIFECICNGFAELSRFADRGFYEDWWNSTTWDEFARKWNKPVHQFLLRHVYASTMSSYKISRQSATFLTFLLSAAVHELVMVIVTKKFRFYLFLLQMIQIPLIALGKVPFIRRNKTLGNIVFWLGLFAGFPLLCVAYCAY